MSKANMFSATTVEEIKLTIFDFIPKRSKIKLQMVNKEWQRLLKDHSFWQNTGAKDYDDFVTRMKVLPKQLQHFVFNNIYPLAKVEGINTEIFSKTYTERLEWFLKEKDLNVDRFNFSEAYNLEALFSDNFMLALYEDLFEVNDLLSLQPELVEMFLSALKDNDLLLDVLRVKKLNLIQLNATTTKYARYILDEHILKLIRDDILTAQAAIHMPTPFYLLFMLFNNSDDFNCNRPSPTRKKALKDKLITPAQIQTLPTALYLQYLLTPNGIAALREKLITLEQVAQMPSERYLIKLFNDDGLAKLRSGEIDVNKFIKLPFDEAALTVAMPESKSECRSSRGCAMS